MALQRDALYPGRWTAASAGHPQGAFKNRTAPGALDGSYIEQAWANDWDGYFSSLLSAAGLTANGTVDAVGASQYFDAFRLLLRAGSNYAVAGGTANAITASLTPAVTSLTSIVGVPIRIKIATLNTGAVTLSLNGLTITPVVNPVGSALVQGQLPANTIATVVYDGTNFQLQTVQTGFGPTTMVSFALGTTAWVCPAGVYRVKVRAWGAGGTGASGNGSNQAGAGGGAGGYGEAWFSVVPGTSYSVVVGTGGTPPVTASSTGLGGGLSSFGALMTVTGGGGGAVFGGAGGVGGTATGATFSVVGNSGAAGAATIGGVGGSPFGSAQALGSTLFGNPAQGPGGAGSGALAASAGNSLAANGALTLEY